MTYIPPAIVMSFADWSELRERLNNTYRPLIDPDVMVDKRDVFVSRIAGTPPQTYGVLMEARARLLQD